MQCKVDGCGSGARYKAAQLCQKHYFRVMRNGTTDTLNKGRKYRLSNPAGYQLLYIPGHQLAHANGYVYEHRAVVYADYGKNIPPCAVCGKQVTWQSCHIDHIDDDVTNNNRDNLRQTCRHCNTSRGRRPECEYERASKITIDGVSMTPHEWSRVKGVLVCGATIRRRKSLGYSDYDSVHGEKITHKNTLPQKQGDTNGRNHNDREEKGQD